MTKKNSPGSESTESSVSPVNDNLRAGLAVLLQAHGYAIDCNEDVWDFAIEIDVLYRDKLTITDLRWLVTKNYVKHGEDVTEDGEHHRAFRPNSGLKFSPTTCFVLTESGVKFAEKVLSSCASTD